MNIALRIKRCGPALAAIAPVVSVGLVALAAMSAHQVPVATDASAPQATLEETRLVMGKWIETQQIISRERKDWQQGKEILVSRFELLRNEVAAIEEKIKQAELGVAEANKKKDELLAENDRLKGVGNQLSESVTGMEKEVRKLYGAVPEAIQTRLLPLSQRIPEDPTSTHVSAAERFQNVLGILNEVNKANNEISVVYEVHSLAEGRRSEVQTIYVGLGQAYYVSANGEAGIGRPASAGWTWEPSKAVGGDVLTALEILQGKHTPTFVALPVRIQ